MSTQRGRQFYTPVLLGADEHAAVRSIADERSCSIGAVLRWAVRKALLADPPDGVKNEGHAVVLDAAGTPFRIQS